jgi:hypothetical protein
MSEVPLYTRIGTRPTTTSPMSANHLKVTTSSPDFRGRLVTLLAKRFAICAGIVWLDRFPKSPVADKWGSEENRSRGAQDVEVRIQVATCR